MEVTNPKSEFSPDDFVSIICPVHGEFRMKVKDHLGENEEQVAYGCFKCEHWKANFNIYERLYIRNLLPANKK